MPVAYEVARALGAPLDVFLVRKLGLPGHEEFAMGAIASGGVRLINEDVVQHYGVTAAEIEAVAEIEQRELERRERSYRDGRPLPRAGGSHGHSRSTTASRPDRQCRRPCWRCGRSRPRRIVVAVPVAARGDVRRVSGPGRRHRLRGNARRRSTPWESGTRTSRKRRTRKSTSS